MPELRVIAIDFDGVIHDYQHPIEGKRMGAPLPGAEEAVGDLYHRGFKIIVFTTKATTLGGKEAVEKWLDYYGIDYHEVTAIKPNAELYIDDRGVHHTSWEQTNTEILSRLGLMDL